MKAIAVFVSFLRSSIVVLVLSILLFAPNAMAAMGMPALDNILENVQIKNGSFGVTTDTINIPSQLRIGKAIVSLPAGETGTIDEIAITGTNGVKIFGCTNLKIKNGTDLIRACGGPAYLVGDVKYYAKGSNFKPQANTTFGVELFPN